ncbi:MAG: elongation factor Ts [Bacilli bacterium]|nr:elongation factor Ts [Bacilli bacterium]
MDIKASDVKALRDMTGAGMLDCKKALAETNGDMDKAVDYLREKGISTAQKKAGRIAAEGLSNIYVSGNKATIIEVNAETDFVAKNAEFVKMVDTIGNAILNSDVSSLDDALNLNVDGGSVNDLIINTTATIGEKLSLRRIESISKNDDEVFGTYLHMGGKIASLVVVKGNDEAVAKDIAMQSAAMRPQYVCREEVPAEKTEHEREVLVEQAKTEGKKEEFIDKIIAGRLDKFYAEICLIEQSFVKDSDLTVKQYLDNNNSSVVKMIRFEVGEGMEKRCENFADEVMSQIK